MMGFLQRPGRAILLVSPRRARPTEPLELYHQLLPMGVRPLPPSPPWQMGPCPWHSAFNNMVLLFVLFGLVIKFFVLCRVPRRLLHRNASQA
eukprot:10339637-Prorocentrum_lima.AAC.1